MKGAREEELVVLSTSYRMIFQVLLWPLVVSGILGNIGVLKKLIFTNSSTEKSSMKPFYRYSLLSLAFSDLLLLGTSGTHIINMISHPTILWSLPNWACIVIPYLQTNAILIASLTLAGVAIHRYAAIKSKFPLTRGSSWLPALSYIVIWSLASVVSFPVLELYTPESLIIINNSTYYTGTLCVADRQPAATVYIALFSIIFLPLAIVFVVIHVLLAVDIAGRKYPGDKLPTKREKEESMSNENSTTTTTIERVKTVNSGRKRTPTSVIRKRRTVRVILILIIVFGICRLPQWIFLITKLFISLNGYFWWHLQILLTTLTLVNATIHPFLYAFLHESLSILTWLQSLCCSTKKSMKIESQLSKTIDPGTTTNRIIIPRGPLNEW